MAKIDMASGLQDIELPPDGVSIGFVVLGLMLVLVFLLLLIWLYYTHQKPLKRARKQLQALTESTVNADNIVCILREGLQVKQLKNSELPDDFILRLEQARFSAEAYDSVTLMDLKHEALLLLTKISSEQGKQ